MGRRLVHDDDRRRLEQQPSPTGASAFCSSSSPWPSRRCSGGPSGSRPSRRGRSRGSRPSSTTRRSRSRRAAGTIVDRNGLQLAIGRDATTVFANPRQVADPRAAALAAGKDLNLDPEELYPKLADRSRGFVFLARKADPERARKLKERGITGIFFSSEERRAYPQGRIAAQVLGYAGLDNQGLAGLELQLDRPLSGSAGRERFIRDPTGRSIDVVDSKPARDGDDVVLTLDHTIQSYAESVLQRTVTNWGAKGGSAIVLDPRNGEILAMAVVPGFDANRYGLAPRDLQRNRAVTDTYEPGSTFKVVTIAAALSTGVVAPGTAFTLPYEIEVADRRIHDSHERETQRMTVAQILSRSSNVGTVTVAQMLGQSRLARWIERFGFGAEDRRRLPGRDARDRAARSRSGRARRSATSPSARASRSRPSRWPPRTAPSRTAASGYGRTSSSGSARGRRRAPSGDGSSPSRWRPR